MHDERLRAHADSEPAVATREPLLSLVDVRFSWPKGSGLVLDIPEFGISQRERVFLAGPSGSGKSTLLALLGGVIRAQSGRVQILGTELGGLANRHMDRFRVDHIGFVFQLFNLVPYLPTLENVLLPCQFSDARADRAGQTAHARQQRAYELLRALELDDEQIFARDVGRLSIGQQQRVAVARALIGAPELLIADEPTSALDEGTRERFLELLFSECKARGTTVLLVSHDRRLGQFFDREIELLDINRALLSRESDVR